MLAYFGGLKWEEWWAAIQGFALIATALIAFVQLRALRSDQRGWETLRACEKYDTDPTLEKALQCLRNGRNASDFDAAPKKYTFEARAVGNYFEGLATGVRQGFYVESIIRDHLEDIMRDFVSEFLYQPRMSGFGFSLAEFSRLIEMLDAWKVDKAYYRRWKSK